MTYDEFIKMLGDPINGKSNHITEVANLAVFCYSLSKVVNELNEKVDNLEKENKRLEDLLIQYNDYFGRKINELERFTRYNVEPDLRYMG
jgi:predicted RNase H-like nuclease (RuvC/YqgF family)